MIKHILTTLLVLISVSCAIAQPGSWGTKNKKAIKYVEEALAATRELDQRTGRPNYKGAIEWCDKAIAKDPDFIDAYLMKGDFAASRGDLLTAVEAYKKGLSINPNYSSTGYIYIELAQMEQRIGAYSDALSHAKFYKTVRGANKEMFPEADWIIKNCKFAINAVNNPVPFKPVNVGSGVNTPDPEYFPTLTVDQSQLLFTRRVSDARSQYGSQEDFFVSQGDNNYWQLGEPMPKNINTTFNEGAPTYAPDGRTLIFVGCANEKRQYGSDRRGYGSCDFFITKKVGDKWLNPINLPGQVNTANWETQPSLSSDGKSLYFIRGQVRNTGGRNKRNGDIYVSKLLSDGSWGLAEKLPSNINTPYSESSVLIHPDGRTLYFASNGHIGMGGYDLYMAQLQPDGTWSDPKNIGYPINTANDENSLLVFADGKLAIFASDRPGGFGNLDLYSFELPKNVRPTKTIYMEGVVFNSVTNTKLEAEFSLKDIETGVEVVHSISDYKTGEFVVTLPTNREYALIVNKKGFNPFTVNFDLTVPENSDKPYHIDAPLIPINDLGREISLKNVFFDLDSYNLRTKSYVELDNLVAHLKYNPKMVIQLQGHTDSQGDDAHNLDLSKSRAKSVMDYLITKGVEKERLSSEGFGETKPAVIKNKEGKDVELTEGYINSLPKAEQKAAHQENRRTIYVVKSL
jgi:outer membrane protein OmpA-like peptidoglycan-associated protein/Tol biopolymer transport system component